MRVHITKQATSPLEIEDVDGLLATPICVAFTDEQVLAGRAATNGKDCNRNSTFMDFMKLLTVSRESVVGFKYTKHSEHKLFARGGHCFLHVPCRKLTVSPEELLAHVLKDIVRLATLRCKKAFSSATIALGVTELGSEEKTRAYAKAAALASLNVNFVSRTAAKGNHIIRDCAWCLQPKAGLIPFLVVDYLHAHNQISLVIVDGPVTSVEASSVAQSTWNLL